MKKKKFRKIVLTCLIGIIIIFLAGGIYIAVTKQGIAVYKPYVNHLKNYPVNLSETEAYEQDFEFIYQEIKNNYVNLEYKEKLLGMDWDEEYNYFKEKLKNIDSKKDFVKLCNEFISCLKDGHTWFGEYNCERDELVWAPYDNGYTSAFQIRLIEEHPIIIANRLNDNLNGYEINSINGVPFQKILDTMLFYIYRSGNDESAKSFLLNYSQFFQYFIYEYDTEPDEYIIDLVNKEGDTKTISFDANVSFQNDYFINNDINFGLEPNDLPSYYIRDNIGYIRIDTFNTDVKSTLTVFDQIVKELKVAEVSGVIIDIRNNGGGNESFRKILGYLTDHEIDIVKYHYRKSERYHDLFYLRFLWDAISSKAAKQSREEGYTDWRKWVVKPAKEQYLTTIPIAVLCNENIFSSAADFVYACQEKNLATVIGSMLPLSGFGLSTENVVPSGKYLISYCFFESKAMNGDPLENVVKEPDVKVCQTYEEYLTGTDTILEEAFKVLIEK